MEPELAAVTDDLLDFQGDTETHQKLWVYFAQLIPPHQRAFLTQYVVFTDGPDETLAFVLKPAPSGDTVADQKVAFFYDYPELVKLRAEISGRLVSRLRRN